MAGHQAAQRATLSHLRSIFEVHDENEGLRKKRIVRPNVHRNVPSQDLESLAAKNVPNLTFAFLGVAYMLVSLQHFLSLTDSLKVRLINAALLQLANTIVIPYRVKVVLLSSSGEWPHV